MRKPPHHAYPIVLTGHADHDHDDDHHSDADDGPDDCLPLRQRYLFDSTAYAKKHYKLIDLGLRVMITSMMMMMMMTTTQVTG
jgi:hypothetical protein